MAIETTWGVSICSRYLGPTNHRGSRVRVRRTDHRPGDRTLMVSWDYSLDVIENHAAAIAKFVKLWGWDTTDWVVGYAGDGECVALRGRPLERSNG